MTETKEIKLPSMGIFGYPEKITIRNLTGADEKILYSGLNENAIDKLLKRCITEPADLDVSAMCEQDKYYILIQIRILTFGSDYSFTTVCPECKGKLSVTIDLDELEVFYADSKFEKSLEFEVPSSKDKIKFKILTTKDINEVNSYIARIKASNDRGTQILVRQASVIETINGEEKTLAEKQKYLEESSSRDINAIWRAFGRINLGVNMNAYINCPLCNKVVSVPVEMNAEFFRPTSEDTTE